MKQRPVSLSYGADSIDLILSFIRYKLPKLSLTILGIIILDIPSTDSISLSFRQSKERNSNLIPVMHLIILLKSMPWLVSVYKHEKMRILIPLSGEELAWVSFPFSCQHQHFLNWVWVEVGSFPFANVRWETDTPWIQYYKNDLNHKKSSKLFFYLEERNWSNFLVPWFLWS